MKRSMMACGFMLLAVPFCNTGLGFSGGDGACYRGSGKNNVGSSGYDSSDSEPRPLPIAAARKPKKDVRRDLSPIDPVGPRSHVTVGLAPVYPEYKLLGAKAAILRVRFEYENKVTNPMRRTLDLAPLPVSAPTVFARRDFRIDAKDNERYYLMTVAGAGEKVRMATDKALIAAEVAGDLASVEKLKQEQLTLAQELGLDNVGFVKCVVNSEDNFWEIEGPFIDGHWRAMARSIVQCLLHVVATDAGKCFSSPMLCVKLLRNDESMQKLFTESGFHKKDDASAADGLVVFEGNSFLVKGATRPAIAASSVEIIGSRF